MRVLICVLSYYRVGSPRNGTRCEQLTSKSASRNRALRCQSCSSMAHSWGHEVRRRKNTASEADAGDAQALCCKGLSADKYRTLPAAEMRLLDQQSCADGRHVTNVYRDPECTGIAEKGLQRRCVAEDACVEGTVFVWDARVVGSCCVARRFSKSSQTVKGFRGSKKKGREGRQG